VPLQQALDIDPRVDLKKEKINETIADWYGSGMDDRQKSSRPPFIRKSSRVLPTRYCCKLIHDDTTYIIGCDTKAMRDQWYNAIVTCQPWYQAFNNANAYFTKSPNTNKDLTTAAPPLPVSSTTAHLMATVPPDFF
jgi:hypothetical protein